VNALAVPMSKAIGQVTLHVRVKGVRIATLRIKLGTLLLKLAARIIGTQIEINMGGEFDELPPPEPRRYMMVGDLEVPRQASVREGSPLHVSNVFDWGSKVDVLLDGTRQDSVVSFDIDAGFVRVCRLDATGKMFVADDEIATEVRRGRVELRPRG
jgi:hypothetical protein